MELLDLIESGKREERRYLYLHHPGHEERDLRIKEMKKKRNTALREQDFRTADVLKGRIAVLLEPERSLMVLPPEPKCVKQTKKGGINMPKLDLFNPHPVVAGLVCATIFIFVGLPFEVTILATGAVCRLVSQRRGENTWKQICYGVGPVIPTLLGSWWLFVAALVFHVFVWKESSTNTKEDNGDDGEDDDQLPDKL